MSRSLLSACRQLDTSCAFIMCRASWQPGGGRSAADGLRRSRPASLRALACRGTSSSSVLAIFMCQRAQAENAPAPAPRCTRARLGADAPTRRRRRLTTAVRDRTARTPLPAPPTTTRYICMNGNTVKEDQPRRFGVPAIPPLVSRSRSRSRSLGDRSRPLSRRRPGRGPHGLPAPPTTTTPRSEWKTTVNEEDRVSNLGGWRAGSLSRVLLPLSLARSLALSASPRRVVAVHTVVQLPGGRCRRVRVSRRRVPVRPPVSLGAV